MARMPGVPFSAPRSFSSGRPGGPPRFIVIHYTAGSEGPTAAEDGIAYDKKRTDGTSAHFYTDRDSIIQCVDTADRSHTALYYGNLWGIHIEQCGTRQTREQWLDAASRPTIRNTAKVCAWAMREHDIPLARLIIRQVRTGKGLCGHYDCTYGFPEDGGTHEDPGTAYPYDVLIADIRAELEGDGDMVEFTPEHARKLDEVHRILYEGRRLMDPPTANQGVPIAWLPRVVKELGVDIAENHASLLAEVDGTEEGQAQVLTAVQAIQAGDPVAIVNALLAALPGPVADAVADEFSARTAS